MLGIGRLKTINKLEIIKYCNKNIEILLAMRQKINNRLLDLLNNGIIDYETYDKVYNVKLLNLREMLEGRYEPTIAKELWNYASRSLLSISTVRLHKFRSEKKLFVNCLGREQFYRQNNLPVELNLMIEKQLEEKIPSFYEIIIFYSLEKAGLIEPMGERDVWYYGSDFRLKNDAPEELRRTIHDSILVPCRENGRGQHNIAFDSKFFCEEFTSHFGCLESSQKLEEFTNQMLEIIEKATVQHNQENENQQSQAEDQTHQAENNETNQESSYTFSESDNASQTDERNNENNSNFSSFNCAGSESSSNSSPNCFSESYSNNYFSSSSSNATDSFTSTNTSEIKENKDNPATEQKTYSSTTINNFPSQEEKENSSVNNSSSSISNGSISISFSIPEENSGINSTVESDLAASGLSQKDNDEQNNKQLFFRKKQKIIQEIQDILSQTPDLKLNEFASYKQEIEQIQSLEALAAYQKNLLEKIEKKKKHLATKQIVFESEVKHNKNNITPVIIAGIAILGVIFWLTISIVRKNINKKGKS